MRARARSIVQQTGEEYNNIKFVRSINISCARIVLRVRPRVPRSTGDRSPAVTRLLHTRVSRFALGQTDSRAHTWFILERVPYNVRVKLHSAARLARRDFSSFFSPLSDSFILCRYERVSDGISPRNLSYGISLSGVFRKNTCTPTLSSSVHAVMIVFVRFSKCVFDGVYTRPSARRLWCVLRPQRRTATVNGATASGRNPQSIALYCTVHFEPF